MNAALDTGEVPTTDLLDGVLVLAAGALLIVPGFITDIIGLALLVPPVRKLVRATALRRLQRRLEQAVVDGRSAGFTFVRMGGGWDGAGRGEFVDVESYEVPDVPVGPPELEGPRR
jgi:UPF0716 protein FxsA